MKMFFKYFETALVLVSAFMIDVWGMDQRYCEDLDPQMEINIDQLTGVWFGVEYITHTTDPLQHQYQYHHNRFEVSDTCFFIDIKEDEQWATTQSYYAQMTPSYQYVQRGAGVVPEQGYRHLVLQWYEPGNRLDYHVRFNMTRRGFWISTEPQYGAAIMAEMYTHFSGTIQVLKAVSNHLVLSFCRRLPKEQLFTVIFSRQKHRLDDGELIGIHNLLSRKQLSTSSIKKVCNSGVLHAATAATSASTALLATLSYFLSHNWRNVL